MTHLFTSYELAVKLKYYGYDDICMGYFGIDYGKGPELVLVVCRNSNESLTRRDFIAAPLNQQVIEFVMKEVQSKYPSSQSISNADGSGVWKSGTYRRKVPSLTIEFNSMLDLAEKALKLI